MTRVYEHTNYLLICTDSLAPEEHQHLAAHVLISLAGDVCLKINGSSFCGRGIAIPPDALHQVEAYGTKVLVFCFDNTTNVAAKINTTQLFDECVCETAVKLFREFEKSGSRENYEQFEKVIFEQLGVEKAESRVTDERITVAMKEIRKNLSEKITCRSVAERVHLSEGRFLHLFRQSTGMTFAAYVIFQRVLYAYTEMTKGKSITEAAVEAGFYSSSHFADVNKRLFGMSASDFASQWHFEKMA